MNAWKGPRGPGTGSESAPGCVTWSRPGLSLGLKPQIWKMLGCPCNLSVCHCPNAVWLLRAQAKPGVVGETGPGWEDVGAGTCCCSPPPASPAAPPQGSAMLSRGSAGEPVIHSLGCPPARQGAGWCRGLAASTVRSPSPQYHTHLGPSLSEPYLGPALPSPRTGDLTASHRGTRALQVLDRSLQGSEPGCTGHGSEEARDPTWWVELPRGNRRTSSDGAAPPTPQGCHPGAGPAHLPHAGQR